MYLYYNMTKTKFNTELCNNDMTFNDCELAILRQAVDEAENENAVKISDNEQVKKMIEILEDFLRRKKCICYGGTAINNILPKHAQFYDKDVEIPDYDFYSSNALQDAKELADIYSEHGFLEIEAKAGVHFGTYKVFVNFIPIADITYIPSQLFKSISNEAIRINGIYYSPPNLLRMNMYIELSRPSGDTSRWEKILKRLILLNKHHPMNIPYNCFKVQFQRKMIKHSEKSENIYLTLRDTFVDQGAVFLGGYASRLYSKYDTKNKNVIARKIPDFDIISENPTILADIAIEKLKEIGFNKVKTIVHDEIGEILPKHIEIRIENETLAFIYYPIACHSYNVINIKGLNIKVATIDTMLSFYLAFYYSDKPYHPKNRILCMSKFLFDIQSKNRLQQKGLLKRFSINCIGNQPTLESIRAEKVDKFKELKDKRGTDEYDLWFLKYSYSNGKLTTPKNKSVKKSKSKKNKTKKKSGILNKISKIFK